MFTCSSSVCGVDILTGGYFLSDMMDLIDVGLCFEL
jgi:hypothetical protein